MTEQLDRIIEDFGTNETLRTNTHHRVMNRFIMKINQLIQLFKKDQQYQEKRERRLKQEITNISHDLRTPLTSIKGFSQLLLDEQITETDKKQYIQTIDIKIDELTSLVDLFYEFSSIGSLDEQVQVEKLYVNTLLEEQLLFFYNQIEKSELKVIVEEFPIVPILGNEKAVNRILINVLQNAFRYAESYVQLELIEEKEYVNIQLSNDVDQFDEQSLQHIFDRSFRMDSSRTDGHLGLGLHIVYQLIELQGGHVNATGANGVFTLNLYFKKWTYV